jgi:hypothetical protein
MTQRSDLVERAAAADDLPDPREVVPAGEEVPVEAVFDEAFVRDHTAFATFDELVAASPAAASSAADLGSVPDGSWDDFVAEHTEFADEEAMVFAAIDEWVADELGL